MPTPPLLRLLSFLLLPSSSLPHSTTPSLRSPSLKRKRKTRIQKQNHTHKNSILFPLSPSPEANPSSQPKPKYQNSPVAPLVSVPSTVTTNLGASIRTKLCSESQIEVPRVKRVRGCISFLFLRSDFARGGEGEVGGWVEVAALGFGMAEGKG